MADRTIKLRRLRRILRRYGVQEDPSRGKGSHVYFFRQLPEGTVGYPVPNKSDVKTPYVTGCRRRFRLTPADGVTDADFYGN
jgi:hypothetical protein